MLCNLARLLIPDFALQALVFQKRGTDAKGSNPGDPACWDYTARGREGIRQPRGAFNRGHLRSEPD